MAGWVWFCWFVDLEAKERVLEDMRLALTEQEETQDQMEQVLEEKADLIQELSSGKTKDLKIEHKEAWNANADTVKRLWISLFWIINGVWPEDSLL